MKVSEYKDIATALSKFATTREKATGPESNIGVQCKAGTLKFISGTAVAGLTVATNDFTSSADGSFIVNARPFLQAAKVLPARSSVDIIVSKDKLTVKTEGGGKIDLDSVGVIRDAGFPKRPRAFTAAGAIDSQEWGRIAKIFKTVSAKIEIPSVQHIDGVGYVSVVAPGMRARYASFEFPSTSDVNGYNMAAYRDFWDGLAALTTDGTMRWGHDGILASDGAVEVFSAPYLVSVYDKEIGVLGDYTEPPATPIMKATGKAEVSVRLQRRLLTDIIRGQAPFDEHNRVTLEVESGKLLITPFGEASGQEVPAETTGRGTRSIRADYLNGLLNSMDAKEVSLQWGSGMPVVSITSEDYKRWTILLAPVTI